MIWCVFFFAFAQLFDKIRTENPGVAEKKIIPILGDMAEIRLGISDDDYDMLVRNVSIVFHVAATVRFDEPIRDAIIKNVRGTREVVRLSEQMKNLIVSKIILVIIFIFKLVRTQQIKTNCTKLTLGNRNQSPGK